MPMEIKASPNTITPVATPKADKGVGDSSKPGKLGTVHCQTKDNKPFSFSVFDKAGKDRAYAYSEALGGYVDSEFYQKYSDAVKNGTLSSVVTDVPGVVHDISKAEIAEARAKIAKIGEESSPPPGATHPLFRTGSPAPSAAVELQTKGFGGVQSTPPSKPKSPETVEIVLGERRKSDGGIDQERFKGYRDSLESHADLEARAKLKDSDPAYLMKKTVNGANYYVDSKTYAAIVKFQAEHPKAGQ